MLLIIRSFLFKDVTPQATIRPSSRSGRLASHCILLFRGFFFYKIQMKNNKKHEEIGISQSSNKALLLLHRIDIAVFRHSKSAANSSAGQPRQVIEKLYKQYIEATSTASSCRLHPNLAFRRPPFPWQYPQDDSRQIFPMAIR